MIIKLNENLYEILKKSDNSAIIIEGKNTFLYNIFEVFYIWSKDNCFNVKKK